MAESFKRPSHNAVLEALRSLDAAFLERNAIYFGGGTRIVLELGEYRESRDVDFLCASVEGYRALRETIGDSSLGKVVHGSALNLTREVRADQYGVRTWVSIAGLTIKFEIVREARIELAGAKVASLPVACLDYAHAFAEKFLANADRGLDASTLSRDAIDLAFMVEAWPMTAASEGAALARQAYGKLVDEKLLGVVGKLRSDRRYRATCIDGLAIEDTKMVTKGLEALARGVR